MEMLLKVLGTIFLAILCLIGLGILWILWKAWGLWRQFQLLTKSMGGLSAGEVPPFRVKLKKVDRPTWADRDQIEFLAGPLRKAGFVDLGLFDVTPSLLRLLALASAKDQIYAAINQHPQSGVFLDLVTAYEDGTFCTYTTTKQAGLLDQPEFKTTKSFPELGADELLRRFLVERPQNAMLPAKAEAFPEVFESFWAREFDWRIARGGVTDEEIRRVAARDGGGILEDNVRLIKLQWRQAINAHYHVELKQNFLAGSVYSAGEWDQIGDRVHFIHDHLAWDEVVAICGLGTDDCAANDKHSMEIGPEADRLAAAFPPREAFGRINQLLRPQDRFEKLGELSSPIAADVYLAPKPRELSVYDEEE